MSYRIDEKYKKKNFTSVLESFLEKELKIKLSDSAEDKALNLCRFDFCVYGEGNVKPVLFAEIKTEEESRNSGSWSSFHRNLNYEQCHADTRRIMENYDSGKNLDNNKQTRDFIIVFLCQLWNYEAKQKLGCSNIWLIQESTALFRNYIDKALQILTQERIFKIVKQIEYENFYFVNLKFI
jgi:hypothetical protein